MGITPWVKGDLAPIWTIPLVLDSGQVNTTGLVIGDFLLVLRNTDVSPPLETTGVGTFSNIVNSTGPTVPATVQYQVASADVTNLGNFDLRVVVQFSNGPQTFDLGPWKVIPA